MECTGRPKLLACQHSLCEGCVGSLQRSSANSVECPMCRLHTFLPHCGPQGLPTNLTLIQLRDVMQDQQNHSKTWCQFCVHDSKITTHYCKQCDDNFCEQCASQHENNKLFVNHVPLPIPVTAEVCKDHKKSFTFFCTDCNRLLCPICVHHKMCYSHNIQSLQDLKQQKLEVMKTLTDKISTNIQIYKEQSIPAVETLDDLLISIKDEIDKIKQHGTNLKGFIDTKVKRLVEEAEAREKMLQHLKYQSGSYELLCMLKETAEAACDRGIEQVLLTLPTIQATLPLDPMPITGPHAHHKLLFIAEHSLNIGAFHSAENMPHAATSTEQGTSGEAGTIKIHVSPKWERKCIADNLWDIAFTGEGNLAFLESKPKTRVGLLNNSEGKLMCDSRNQGVRLGCPRGIAFHPKENVLLVCDQTAGRVIFLNSTNLKWSGQIKISGIKDPTGIAVLSDGNIVVTGSQSSVGLFDIDGFPLHLWEHVNQYHTAPLYVAVDQQDNILMSLYRAQKIIKLIDSGATMVQQATEGLPCGVAVASGNILLVAQQDPDCIMAYSMQADTARHILTWESGNVGEFGSILSVAVYDDYNLIAIMGQCGIKLVGLSTPDMAYSEKIFETLMFSKIVQSILSNA